jgi:hypothetical protein
MVFISGDKMNGPDSVSMPRTIAPAQTVDISVNFTAPNAVGQYQGYWQLQTSDGKNFGVGASATEHVWVKIKVTEPIINTMTVTPALSATASLVQPTSTVTVLSDFVGNACTAQWQTSAGTLPCPGAEGDPRGFVLVRNQANLEDGSTVTLPTLLTYPQDSPDGYILGIYPEYQVQSGDHFQATVGCEQNATLCSVLFRLSYLDSIGAPHDLWTLGEFYDGKYFNLDLDLSQLAGQKVRLTLSTASLGSAAGDRALWVAPRIIHFAVEIPTSQPTSTATLQAPSATLAPSPTSVTTPAPAALTPTPAATPPAGNQNPAPSPLQQILDRIISFFRQLFGGK